MVQYSIHPFVKMWEMEQNRIEKLLLYSIQNVGDRAKWNRTTSSVATESLIRLRHIKDLVLTNTAI
ncbi:hypothetical protein DPMN_079527 [Dreissena polymorpha]|uniref:Uncharacterized protein n=1 Tax=Dreissena polymorpha TaxID=45954 RepID=A0A9D3YTX7_DREPO|nr:hypothetical protein DPMN_079527 [Dreissena polymorpha]